MDGQAILAVSGAVVAFTSLIKWAGAKDHWGPIVSIVCSLVGVVIWAYSKRTYSREVLFDFFAGWIAVATAAAGIYGYTRSLPASVLTADPRSPLPGAFQGKTVKPGDQVSERRNG